MLGMYVHGRARVSVRWHTRLLFTFSVRPPEQYVYALYKYLGLIEIKRIIGKVEYHPKGQVTFYLTQIKFLFSLMFGRM